MEPSYSVINLLMLACESLQVKNKPYAIFKQSGPTKISLLSCSLISKLIMVYTVSMKDLHILYIVSNQKP